MVPSLWLILIGFPGHSSSLSDRELGHLCTQEYGDSLFGTVLYGYNIVSFLQNTYNRNPQLTHEGECGVYVKSFRSDLCHPASAAMYEIGCYDWLFYKETKLY